MLSPVNLTHDQELSEAYQHCLNGNQYVRGETNRLTDDIDLFSE